MQEQTILIIGAGNMGCSLARGLIDHGWKPSQISLCESHHPKHEQLNQLFPGSTIIDTPASYQNKPSAIILAVKPHDLPQTCKQIAEHGFDRHTLFISIAAGAPIASLRHWLGKDSEIVRCMPNTPASIGMGMTGLYTDESTPGEHKVLADNLLTAVGKTVWVESEQQLDAITALSGSGPAYLFYLMECIQEAGQALGLNEKDCYQLTLQTMLGAAQLAQQEAKSFDSLRESVTSKGGTTEHAIKTLEKHEFRKIVAEAIQAANARAGSISQSFED
jgi:pyrroline-5-carboxylate reductase